MTKLNLAQAVARAGPWLAPITPAYFIYRSMVRHLETPHWVGVIAGLTVEIVGVAVSQAVIRNYTWNREKRKIDPAAPLRLPAALAVSYLLIGISLTSLLELLPQLAPAAPAVFFLMAGIAYVTIALGVDQERRETETTEAKKQAKAERQERKKMSVEHPADKQTSIEPSPELDGHLDKIRQMSGPDPFGQAQVQQWTGAKRTTAYTVLNYGQQIGTIQQVSRGRYICTNGVKSQ